MEHVWKFIVNVSVGLVLTGPLACLSPFAIMSVEKGHLLSDSLDFLKERERLDALCFSP